MDRQIYKGLDPMQASMMSVCLKQRALNILETMEFGFTIILQICLAIKALEIIACRLGIKDGRKSLRAHDKKVRREGVALEEASGGGDSSHNIVIDIERIGH